MRLFSKSADRISVDGLWLDLAGGSRRNIVVTRGTPEHWDCILVADGDQKYLCEIERNRRGADTIFDEELAEFLDTLGSALPRSGAEWVADYLRSAQTIYAARYLEAAFELAEDDHPGPADILWAIEKKLGGILQADGEGFTNEEGYTVVWDFKDDANGPWWVAVRKGDGRDKCV
jgi:hypothetical protein